MFNTFEFSPAYQQQQQQQQHQGLQSQFNQPSSHGMWSGGASSIPALPDNSQRRHSYAAPPTNQRPRHSESLFFARSNSQSSQAGSQNVFSPPFGGGLGSPSAGAMQQPTGMGQGMAPLNVPQTYNISPVMPGFSPNSGLATSPGSRSLWSTMNTHGSSAVDDETYGGEFFLAGTPAKHQRSFSFEQEYHGNGAMSHPREIVPQHQPRNYHTPGSHLLSCEEEDEDGHLDRITSRDTLGAIGSSLGSTVSYNTFGSAISPVSSHDSTVSSSSTMDSDAVGRYFYVDELGRNATVNSEMIRRKSIGSRHLSSILPPSPPFRAHDLADLPTNAAAFINTPSKKLYFVQFKSARMDVFFVPETSVLVLNVGDYVIVDGDRGRDLGRVARCHVTAEEAGILKFRRHKEQQAILQHVPGASTQSSTHSSADKGSTTAAATGSGGTAASTPGVCTPKQILRFAQRNEISQIMNKQSDEDKAVALCLQKVEEKNLSMSVLDAEYQWDRRKLTFFYSADQRIDFRDLVRELFRIYKTRIWMCAVGSQDGATTTISPCSSPKDKHMVVDERQYGITTSKLFNSGPGLSRYA